MKLPLQDYEKLAPNQGQGREKIMVYKKLQIILARRRKMCINVAPNAENFVVKQTVRVAAAALAMGFAVPACAAPPGPVQPSIPAAKKAQIQPGKTVTNAKLPPNQRFPSLDAYLMFLQRTQGPVDGPWYMEIRPGVYQMQTGNLRILTADGEAKPDPKIFTREELMKKFGFTR